jgi:hypothetical protein
VAFHHPVAPRAETATKSAQPKQATHDLETR